MTRRGVFPVWCWKVDKHYFQDLTALLYAAEEACGEAYQDWLCHAE